MWSVGHCLKEKKERETQRERARGNVISTKRNVFLPCRSLLPWPEALRNALRDVLSSSQGQDGRWTPYSSDSLPSTMMALSVWRTRAWAVLVQQVMRAASKAQEWSFIFGADGPASCFACVYYTFLPDGGSKSKQGAQEKGSRATYHWAKCAASVRRELGSFFFLKWNDSGVAPHVCSFPLGRRRSSPFVSGEKIMWKSCVIRKWTRSPAASRCWPFPHANPPINFSSRSI